MRNLGICVNMPAEFKCYSRCSRVLCPVFMEKSQFQIFKLKEFDFCVSPQNQIDRCIVVLCFNLPAIKIIFFSLSGQTQFSIHDLREEENSLGSQKNSLYLNGTLFTCKAVQEIL